MTADLGLILHVTTNHFDPYGYFDRPADSASSTFWIRKDGHVEQYVEVGVTAWAQAAGNHTYNSVETDGTVDEPLSPEQIEALAQLYFWGHVHRGWKIQLAEKPGDEGFGWHGMGGEAWGNHPGCPGEIRKDQRQAVLDRVNELVAEAAVPPKPVPAPSHPVLPSPQPKPRPVDMHVAELQRDVRETSDNIWGPITDHALLEVRSAAMHGPFDVRFVQERVGTEVDGIWGPKSKAALVVTVKAVQSVLGVVVDGIWGPHTDAAFQNARARYRRA